MKITITYIPSETREADMILRLIRSLLPSVKVRKSDRRPPYLHIYLTTKRHNEQEK